MLLPADQVAELKSLCPRFQYFEESRRGYVLLPGSTLPNGTTPAACDLFLCPHERDGYPSRLFFSTRVTRSPTATTKDALNWNAEVRLIERTWYAFSWKTTGGPYTLVQLVALHLRALQ